MLSETSDPPPPGPSARSGALASLFGTMAFDLLRPRVVRRPTPRRRFHDDAPVADVVWLKVLSPELRARAEEALTLRTLGEGESLILRGQPLGGWHGVVNGFLSIEADNTPFWAVGAGVAQRAWFGEDYLLDGRPCDCTLVARAPTLVMTLPESTFTELLEEPAFCKLVMRVQSQRFLALRERLAWASRVGVNTRVALVIAGLFPGDALFEGMYRVELTQAALARFVGLSRQRTNEALRQLQRLGEIELEYGALRVRNPRQLAQRAFAGGIG